MQTLLHTCHRQSRAVCVLFQIIPIDGEYSLFQDAETFRLRDTQASHLPLVPFHHGQALFFGLSKSPIAVPLASTVAAAGFRTDAVSAPFVETRLGSPSASHRPRCN